MFDIQKIVRQCILNRKEYIPGKPIEEVEREYGITDIVKLASNENPLGASPLAVEAMTREIQERSHLYPESLCHDLTRKLAVKSGLRPESIFMDNGADGVISMIGFTFLNPEDEVIFAEISFPAYDNIAAKMGSKSVRIPMRQDLTTDVDGMIKAVTENTKLIFLCNPNNPTGLITSKKELDRLMAQTPENVLVISDEAYFEFADHDKNYPDTLSYLDKHKNLIILRSFSKVMGLAGLRLGYAMAGPEIVKAMLKAREPFPVNRIAQAGALAALDDDAFIEKTRRLNQEGLRFYYDAFDAMGLTCYKSHTNFIMVDVGMDADFVFEELLKKGIIVRPLKSQGIKNGLRITVGLPEQNDRVIKALKEILTGTLQHE
ncbi:MAG: histidinol-phosphate transaminase [Desulfobacula sp.]|jgi:histidinol-phosphate aminotransferase